MGSHGCTPYCDLHPAMHEVLQGELESGESACYLSNEELKTELLKKRQVFDELIAVLVSNPQVTFRQED